MPNPESGPISFADLNTNIGRTSTQQLDLDTAASLYGIPTKPHSMNEFYGLPVFIVSSIRISSDDAAGPSSACENDDTERKYYIGTLGNGTILYDDVNRTIPFGGSGDYYKIGCCNSGKISNSGVISLFSACVATTTTTSTLPPSTLYYATSNYAFSACDETTGLIELYLSGNSTIPAAGLTVYTDATLDSVFGGTNGEYVGLNTTFNSAAIYSIIVDDFGQITSFDDCSSPAPPTTSAPTTAAPAFTEYSLGFGNADFRSCDNFSRGNTSSYWGNDSNFYNATVLYSDANGRTLAPTGYYAGDFGYRFWLNNFGSFSGGVGECDF